MNGHQYITVSHLPELKNKFVKVVEEINKKVAFQTQAAINLGFERAID